jgi:hypothetical protein
MTRRRPDPFATALYGERRHCSVRQRWSTWKKTGLPIAAAVAVTVLVAIVTDLPSHQSLAGPRAAGTALVDEVNSDISPCAFSIEETSTLYHDEVAGELSRSDRPKVPSLLQDDENACSFTSSSINDLADIEEPGTGAGKYLAQIVDLAQAWTTADALGAIEDVDALSAHPHDGRAGRDLSARLRDLAEDRRAALAALADADRYLEGELPLLDMPSPRFAS